jgi:hypothetical protein
VPPSSLASWEFPLMMATPLIGSHSNEVPYWSDNSRDSPLSGASFVGSIKGARASAYEISATPLLVVRGGRLTLRVSLSMEQETEPGTQEELCHSVAWSGRW